MDDPRFHALAGELARGPAAAPAPPGVPSASVALLLREGAFAPELLLIRRAERAGDPWSGHMALPGGRRDPADADDEHAAARETREEVGVDVRAHGRLLGPLPVVAPVSGAPRIRVAPFAYAVRPGLPLRTNAEVALALWVPVDELRDPGAAREHLYELADGTRLPFPALNAGGHVVWGLTYRILTDFFTLYARCVGP